MGPIAFFRLFFFIHVFLLFAQGPTVIGRGHEEEVHTLVAPQKITYGEWRVSTSKLALSLTGCVVESHEGSSFSMT